MELQILLDRKVHFDLIQFPYNIFDRQFEKYFKLMRENNIEAPTRSILLQGSFFKNINTLPEFLVPLRSQLKELHNHCDENRMTIEELALNFVIQNKYIDKVLIGLDIKSQLKNIFNTLKYTLSEENIYFIDSLNFINKSLLSLINWK